MQRALIIINNFLLEYGLSQKEINHLLACFLEEEASDYVEAMEKLKDYFNSNDTQDKLL